jgi:hypothetical protein
MTPGGALASRYASRARAGGGGHRPPVVDPVDSMHFMDTPAPRSHLVKLTDGS